MGVGRPRIGLAVPAHERAAATGTPAAQIPNAPSTWTQAPRSWAIGTISSSGSKAPLFTLPAWAQTIAGPSIPARASRRASGRIRPWSSAAIRADALALPAQAEHLERRVDRDVGPAVGHDGDRRRALQAVPLDVPADPCEDPVARRGERREVGHRRAGHEPDARPGRQVEQLDQPGRRHLLGDRGGRRHGVQRRRSGPRRLASQSAPGRRARRRRRRTRSSAARPSATRPGSAAAARSSMTRDRIRRTVGQRSAHRRPERGEVDRPADRPRVERAEVGRRELGGPVEQSGVVGHRWISSAAERPGT